MGEHAAGDVADARRRPGDRTPDGEGAGVVPPLIGQTDQRDEGGEHRRAGDALHRPGGDPPYGADAVRYEIELTTSPPTSADELAERSTAAGMALDRPVTEADPTVVPAFPDRWAEVVDAPADERRAALLNALLADAACHPRVTDHANGGRHIHYREDGQSLGGVLRAVGSVGTALHLTGLGTHRLGRCALAECGHAYADFSRAGRQRYRSPTCADRDAVRRHRARAGLRDSRRNGVR
ncbi:hypothetical protein GCM10010211_28160 [Streptomyces albospinus]|uniref:Zinc finger CGNR domain-containing protein n=1 Tax=Streptomyces albospinus TaxID=285515 RepID=A0ABQ2V1I1_9ACTN|nr:CGNR zinc finger domain-containing protein [Streptomyces albospinus]GGU61522.1 hypothetical protein GCM10010211_28160 [Streptomyces albospinus]